MKSAGFTSRQIVRHMTEQLPAIRAIERLIPTGADWRLQLLPDMHPGEEPLAALTR